MNEEARTYAQPHAFRWERSGLATDSDWFI